MSGIETLLSVMPSLCVLGQLYFLLYIILCDSLILDLYVELVN